MRIGPRHVRLAAQSWMDALALRPLLWSLPFVVLGCVFGRAWADALRAHSPRDALLISPLFLGPLCLTLKYLQAPRIRAKPRAWWQKWPIAACVLGLMTAHAAMRWTPSSDDVSRLLAYRESRLRPLEPLRGRVIARIIELKRGENSDFAVLELSPAPMTSSNLRGVRGRVWAEMKHSPQVLAARAGDWIRARVELRELRAPGSATEQDERTFALIRGCWCEGTVKSIEARAPATSTWPIALGDWVEAARTKIAARFESGFGRLEVPYARQSALVATAMAFGEGGLREPLPSEMRQAFKRAGVSHVLVASGAQVGIVCLLLWSVARAVCAPLRHGAARGVLMALLIVPSLLFYALLVGGAASIWRATLIGLGAFVIQARGRQMDAISLWCGALSMLLICDPASLYDLSLQLSFGAAWGLIAFSSPLQKFLMAPLQVLAPQRAPQDADDSPSWTQQILGKMRQITPQFLAWKGLRGIVGVASVSLAAHIGTLPVLLHAFGTLSLASLWSNLPIVPMSALLVVSGSASLALPLALLDRFNYALADGTARVVGMAASWQSAWVEAPALSLAWSLFLGASALVLAGALAWPQLLFAQRSGPETNASEQDEPRAPSAHEAAQLWRASAQFVIRAATSAREKGNSAGASTSR